MAGWLWVWCCGGVGGGLGGVRRWSLERDGEEWGKLSVNTKAEMQSGQRTAWE